MKAKKKGTKRLKGIVIVQTAKTRKKLKVFWKKRRLNQKKWPVQKGDVAKIYITGILAKSTDNGAKIKVLETHKFGKNCQLYTVKFLRDHNGMKKGRITHIPYWDLRKVK